jgi:tRNA A-37 threonylcarbamoyl transferase component Bud32
MAASNIEEQILGGRYEIKSLIGQGGMSAVYKAYDPNLRRTVAIKVIHPHLSNNPEFVRRFEEEATAVARLRHPNIVQVFDFNHDGDLYFMVLEFILGETLQDRLKRLNESGRHLPMEDAIKYMVELCEAAGYAHERGMIHRDIKPANVMLDVNGNAILMDFGIARIMGGTQHTATGAVLGTAKYMSPEQIQGLHADARADIYSLGVTLYEMLSGRPPFEADSAMTLMMMHVNDPVPDIRAIQPDAPPALVEVINKSTAKNREQRYQSTAEMAAALRQVQVQPQPAAAAVAQVRPVPAAEHTFIEAAPQPVPDGTLIEPAGAGEHTDIEPPSAGGAPPSTPAAPFPTSPGQSAYPVRQQGSRLWMGVLALLAVVVLLGGGYFAYQQFFKGNDPPAAAVLPAASATELAAVVLPAATDTSTPTLPPEDTPTNAPAPSATPTETAVPTDTPEPTPAAPVIGGADKLAYLQGSNVWIANLDGSGLSQLTSDGTAKTYLRWLPDGEGLSYISGKCIQTVNLSGEIQQVTCFNRAEYLDAFEVSPDGSQVALSLDRQIYLLPFDLARLGQATTHPDLEEMAACPDLAPYQRNLGHEVRWSRDGTRWAAVVLGVLSDGRRGDLVQVFNVDTCVANPKIQLQFPEPFFSYPEYDRHTMIETLAWDGDALFVFNGDTRNDGFGNLHVFNSSSYSADLSINPVRGSCCYRDPAWSPDGTHIIFAFQDLGQGANSTTQLYYIPFNAIGTGAAFEPLPLPEISDPRARAEPVLRPASTP